MRARALFVGMLLLPLAGCLEDREAQARLDETRSQLDEAQAQLADLTAEGRAWRDAAFESRNETNLTKAQRDDLAAMLDVSQEERALAQAGRAAREAELARAREELAAARVNVSDLEARLALDSSAESLARSLDAAKSELARLQVRYDAAAAGKFTTLTSIERANVTWQFTDLRGDARQWRYPMEAYRQDVKRIRPDASLLLDTVGGRHLRVPDPRPYLDAEPFEASVSQLTNRRTAQEFVREVFHMKSQLVDYSFSLVDEKGFYKYPGETLVEGTGVCGDTTILLASVLQAGNAQAGYGMRLALWVVDYDPGTGGFVRDSETVDHGLIEVTFADGTTWNVESTSHDFLLHPQVHGWRFAWDA